MSTKNRDNLKFIDCHTHTQFAVFAADYKEVIERALKEGIGIVNVGTQKDTSLRAVEVACEFEKQSVYATVGLHPIHAQKSFYDPNELDDFSSGKKSENGKTFLEAEKFDFNYYKDLAKDKKVLAIGECGLDYYHLSGADEEIKKSKEEQKRVFLEQVKLAYEVKKPLMIHCRNAFKDLIEILFSFKSNLLSPPGIIHFFSGTIEESRKLLELGFYFTFGGAITFPQSKGKPNYEEIIKFLPIDRILTETDAPYVSPSSCRGKRNEPLNVIEITQKIAEIKKMTLEKTSIQLIENAAGIFNLSSLKF